MINRYTLLYMKSIINKYLQYSTGNYIQYLVIINNREEFEENIYICKTESLCPVAAAAKLLQSCPTLCDPIDGSPPGSSIPGILQARTLEWVAISFFSAGKCKVKVKSLSCVRLLTTPWTAAFQAAPSTGFSRQEYWTGVSLPSTYNVIFSLNL